MGQLGPTAQAAIPRTYSLHTPGTAPTPAQYQTTPGEILTFSYDGGGLLRAIGGQRHLTAVSRYLGPAM